ncbi:alpha-glucosidase [Falsirhodobacter halotolerans]|uniref:alpha-glucosidase n=1 Tax=Falsirhodobacter halotolerans TaxID=1146892 RepID=UPI001FD33B9C|nr:alpha-glucosidase [Falsirhodobacter halotolerans]MCJ8140686.1 alpha-glucosidase family protein [Falsirhodobacter halotolerans]
MQDWWRGSVTYQIYPRSFQDDNGDGIGDLPGITRRLPHVASLGVDAIWLSPFYPSPMLDMGYDVSDYYDVHPEFGTLADFDDLVRVAHDLGLKVIVDLVIAHCSHLHPIFAESRRDRTNPKADWFVWADPQPDGGPPNNWLAIFGGTAWTWDAGRRQYYLHNFLAEQPAFNFHNPQVQEYFLDVFRFWLDRGVDGFRLDTVNYYFQDRALRSNPALDMERPPINPYDMQDQIFSKSRPENLPWLERMRAVTDAYDARMMVGEVGDALRGIEIMGEYTTGTKRLHMAYSFDMLGDHYEAGFFRQAIEGFFRDAPDGWPCWAFSNHDVPRHAGRWSSHGQTEDVAKQSAALLCSFEGSLCLYQGEELGQTDTELQYSELTDPKGLRFWPDEKGRDGCRTPMAWDDSAEGGFTTGTPWLPVKPPQAARNVAAQEEGDTVLNTYRAVLAFRSAHPVLRTGHTAFHDLPEPILAFTRWHEDVAERVLCVFNLGANPVAVAITGGEELIGPHRNADLSDGTLRLGPNGYAWLPVGDAVTVVRA